MKHHRWKHPINLRRAWYNENQMHRLRQYVEEQCFSSFLRQLFTYDILVLLLIAKGSKSSVSFDLSEGSIWQTWILLKASFAKVVFSWRVRLITGATSSALSSKLSHQNWQMIVLCQTTCKCLVARRRISLQSAQQSKVWCSFGRCNEELLCTHSLAHTNLLQF